MEQLRLPRHTTAANRAAILRNTAILRRSLPVRKRRSRIEVWHSPCDRLTAAAGHMRVPNRWKWKRPYNFPACGWWLMVLHPNRRTRALTLVLTAHNRRFEYEFIAKGLAVGLRPTAATAHYLTVWDHGAARSFRTSASGFD